MLKSSGSPLPPYTPASLPLFLHLILSNVSKGKEERPVQQDCFAKLGWWGQLSIWLRLTGDQGSTSPYIVFWNICRLSEVVSFHLELNCMDSCICCDTYCLNSYDLSDMKFPVKQAHGTGRLQSYQYSSFQSSNSHRQCGCIPGNDYVASGVVLSLREEENKAPVLSVLSLQAAVLCETVQSES